jgi:hypothetical protein
MKTPVHLLLRMIESICNDEDPENAFDLRVQYISKDIITFPRVEERPGSGNLPGCKSFPVFKGLVPDNFTRGSFTWKGSNAALQGDELYAQRK